MAAISYQSPDEAYNFRWNITSDVILFPRKDKRMLSISSIQDPDEPTHTRTHIQFNKRYIAPHVIKNFYGPKELTRRWFWEPNFKYRNRQLEVQMLYRALESEKVYVRMKHKKPLLSKPDISRSQKRRNYLNRLK